jgi:hypothetical protein
MGDRAVDSEGHVYEKGWDGQYHQKEGIFGPERDLGIFGTPKVERDIFGNPKVERDWLGNERTSSSGEKLYRSPGSGGNSAGDAVGGAIGAVIGMLLVGVIIAAGYLIVGVIKLCVRYPRAAAITAGTLAVSAALAYGVMLLADGNARRVAAEEAAAARAAAWEKAEAARVPELLFVPTADRGIGFDEPIDDDVYPLIELSTGKHIFDRGRPVYVDSQGERVYTKDGLPPVLVVANTEGQGVYLRGTPEWDDKLRAWPDGTLLETIGGKHTGEDTDWYEVRDPLGNAGWVPQEYVEPVDG